MNEVRSINPSVPESEAPPVTLHPRRRWWRARERGAATAEYAIVIMAAVGFAGLLVVIMRSEEVRAILTDLVQSALTSGG
ncbi:DUF4244 domain-containing protein [Salinibacterium sp. SYSU T00001]|uniref:DUF4244 domain-containing protein n=1 Tax=Homoserinimonas sedimenticola TaxID=2986805 RepID=UPI00223647AF|nr:DUF4244 domain-containing protein [Salinibacterium sedimenticola]MCW4385166.1 DUF4244 domain-containing protein [Salinibacterium sedimenticola]